MSPLCILFIQLAIQPVKPRRLNQFRINEPGQQRPADNNGRKHTDNNTESQVDGKAFNRTGTHGNQYDGGNHDGYVRIQNSTESTLKAGMHGRTQTFAYEDFFFKSFKYKDIRINGKTHGKDNAGNPRERQCRIQIL